MKRFVIVLSALASSCTLMLDAATLVDSCLNDEDCASDFVCLESSCLPACEGSEECEEGLVCTNRVCVEEDDSEEGEGEGEGEGE